MKIIKFTLPVVLFAMLFASCGNSSETENTDEQEQTQEETVDSDDPLMSKGIGPITSVDMGALDEDLAAQGEELFKSKCSACHKVEKRFVGPAMQGVLERRSPEWVMNMILNPEEMVEEDPIAMELFAEYLSPMANQSLTEDEARAILEYFRTF